MPEEKRLKRVNTDNIMMSCMYAILLTYRVDSEHNLQVVGWVADELPSGNKYSKADVKSEFVHGYVYLFIFVHTEALQTYR